MMGPLEGTFGTSNGRPTSPNTSENSFDGGRIPKKGREGASGSSKRGGGGGGYKTGNRSIIPLQ